MRGSWPQPFALGLQYELTGRANATIWEARLDGLLQPDGVLRFSFPPIRNVGQGAGEAWTGTTVVFLRLYTMPDATTAEGRKPFSNACAALIDVH
jgi:hypothetical protein